MDIEENRKQTDEHGGEGQDGDNSHGKLDDMIKDLSTSLWGVKNEQEYMQVIYKEAILFYSSESYIWFIDMTKQITFCDACNKEPFLCLQCFNKID